MPNYPSTSSLRSISQQHFRRDMTGPRSAARHNACAACTKSKRACDRQTPRCGRCADRGLGCQYPSRSRRGNNTALAPRLSAPVSDLFSTQTQGPIDILEYNLESRTLAEAIIPYAGPELSWFLVPDSWDIKHDFSSSHAPPYSLFKDLAEGLTGWLRDWVKNGHNIFIHRHLYGSSLPSCLEDAYTTLACYLTKTEETENMVLQIVENRATRLFQQATLLEGVETLDTKARLARTQALMVYTIIQLFDGCPRQRAIAEGSLLDLYQWCHQMRDSALEEAPRICAQIGQSRFGDGALESGIWRAWILSESLRRTWMIASSTINVYQARKDGWSVCPGMLMFTPRDGLWEAPSAWRWMQQLRNQSPLFDQSANSIELMKATRPAEIDAFTTKVLSVVLPSGEMDRWQDETIRIEG